MPPFSRLIPLLVVCVLSLPVAKAKNLTMPHTTKHRSPSAVPAPEMREIIERFAADESNVNRIYSITYSAQRRKQLTQLYGEAMASLGELDFSQLSFDGKVDYALLRNYLQRETRRLQIGEEDQKGFQSLIPFADTVVELEESRSLMKPVDAEKAAAALNHQKEELERLTAKLEELKPTKFAANQAIVASGRLKETLRHWFEFYKGYDPIFTWWVADPYQQFGLALDKYVTALKEKVLGIKDTDNKAIVGNPIGAKALSEELQFAMIPYTPAELLAIGEKEYAWCLSEMKKASRELGYGDDWKAALEHVKKQHVEPGKQPELIHALAVEAIKFLDDHDLVTVPTLARETWKMEMLSPEQQLVSPFFLGGEDILVSYPTDTMTHEQKMMSMRGNNRYFSRATVQHELIPGHHLQWFMNQRYKPYRGLFYTPFWIEGWALYWEMLLWDKGFPRTPEEKIGMLFWRMHRCVRIVFSINFHLGKLTPEQCVDMLVDRVGHERANAEGEVRRSLNGSYEPVYQLAYMIGGLQFRALHHDLVDSGKMTDRQFHDAILHENTMPVEMVRAVLTKEAPTKNFKTSWRFAG